MNKVINIVLIKIKKMADVLSDKFIELIDLMLNGRKSRGVNSINSDGELVFENNKKLLSKENDGENKIRNEGKKALEGGDKKDLDAEREVENKDSADESLVGKEPIKKGVYTVSALSLFFLVWGCLMKIDSAAIATGTIVVDTNKKTIQHLEGGIIEEILVVDGQEVKAGQPLIRLDTVSAKANLDLLNKQMFTLQASKRRLEVERDMEIVTPDKEGKDSIVGYSKSPATKLKFFGKSKKDKEGKEDGEVAEVVAVEMTEDVAKESSEVTDMGKGISLVKDGVDKVNDTADVGASVNLVNEEVLVINNLKNENGAVKKSAIEVDAGGLVKDGAVAVKSRETMSKVDESGYIIVVAGGGNTVYRFSRRYNVSPFDIIAANDLKKPYLLEIGQKIKIPQSEKARQEVKLKRKKLKKQALKTKTVFKKNASNKIKTKKKGTKEKKIEDIVQVKDIQLKTKEVEDIKKGGDVQLKTNEEVMTIDLSSKDKLGIELDKQGVISSELVGGDIGTLLGFKTEMFDSRDDSELIKILEGEIKLFKTRKKSIEGQLGLLSQKKGQYRKQIEGLRAQQRATNKRIRYINDELKSTEILYKKGIVSKIRYLDLKKQMAELEGDKGEYISSIAQAQQSIGETDMEIINTKTQWLNTIVEELQQVQTEIVNLQERIVAADDVLRRTVIVSPQNGVVTDMKFYTKGGVIPPNAPIMDIVPQDDELVVEARVNPQDIDVVHAGLKAKVVLSAYKQKKVPMLHGEVIYVSADSFLDQMTGMSYYKARVRIDAKELEALKDVKLYPGMPAETYIVTGSRTFFQYLVSPITDSMRRAFRED